MYSVFYSSKKKYVYPFRRQQFASPVMLYEAASYLCLVAVIALGTAPTTAQLFPSGGLFSSRQQGDLPEDISLEELLRSTVSFLFD